MAKRKYSEDETLRNLTAGLNAKGGTYHSYMSMLGESFTHRVDLLSQILGGAHHLTTGRFRESLLANMIAEFLPSRYSVGTGFVLFPEEAYNVEGHDEESEAILDIRKHVPSRQIDILVYDDHSFPVVFRDGDVVVVRPEAVRCVIEVKGAVDQSETDDMVGKFIDFGRKWRNCIDCYRACGIELAHTPRLLGMCWRVADVNGVPQTDGKRLRERIVKNYKDAPDLDIDGLFPLLSAVCIWRKHIVASARHLGGEGVVLGYETLPGQVRFGQPQELRTADRTVAFLLEWIHLSLDARLAVKAFSAPAPEDRQVEIAGDPMLGFTEVVSMSLDKLHPPPPE